MSRLFSTPRRAIGAGIAALTLLATAACSAPGGASAGGSAEGSLADMAPVVLKVSTLYGPENWQSVPMNDFAAAIEQKSGGKISFEFFYGGSLVAPDEVADGLRDGLVDMAYFVQLYTPAKFPMDDWIAQNAFLSDPDPIAGQLQAMGAVSDWGINDADAMAEFADYGMTPLIPRTQVIHQYGLLCKDPVATLEQAKGKKARVAGQTWGDAAVNLGMTPVQTASDEMYTSLQRGLVDCFIGGEADMGGLKMTEVAKNYTPAAFTGFSSYAIALSSKTWETLPLDAQQLIWDEIPTYLESFARSSFTTVGAFFEQADEVGLITNTPDAAFASAVERQQDEVAARLLDTAPASVADPKASLDSFAAAHERWLRIVDELGYSGIPADEMATVDVGPWVDQMWVDVFEPHRPK